VNKKILFVDDDPAALELYRQMLQADDVVRGNLDIAQKMLAAKPDKDMQARAKKMLSDCDKADKKKV
jgi:hypothetical protein